MKDAEKLSNNQSPNVPVAKEEKPEDSTIKAESQISFPEPPTLQVDFTKLNPDMLKTAENIGIPLSAILKYVSDLQAWSKGTEARMAVVLNVLQHFDEGVKASVGKMIKEAQEQQAKNPPTAAVPMQPGAAGQPGGFNLASLLQMAPQLMQMFGGGGGSEFGKLAETMAIESMRQNMAFGKAFQDAILSKMGSKVADQIVAAVVP